MSSGGTPWRKVTVVAATVIAALVAPAVASASDWYVSKQGDDSHTCSSPAATDACLTIQHVAGGVAQSGDTIHVGPGGYAEAVSAGTTSRSCPAHRSSTAGMPPSSPRTNSTSPASRGQSTATGNTGRIGRALKPGRYSATITTTDIAGNPSTAHVAAFTVVKG